MLAGSKGSKNNCYECTTPWTGDTEQRWFYTIEGPCHCDNVQSLYQFQLQSLIPQDTTESGLVFSLKYIEGEKDYENFLPLQALHNKGRTRFYIEGIQSRYSYHCISYHPTKPMSPVTLDISFWITTCTKFSSVLCQFVEFIPFSCFNRFGVPCHVNNNDKNELNFARSSLSLLRVIANIIFSQGKLRPGGAFTTFPSFSDIFSTSKARKSITVRSRITRKQIYLECAQSTNSWNPWNISRQIQRYPIQHKPDQIQIRCGICDMVKTYNAL